MADENTLKQELETIRPDVDLGQVLAVDLTPEEDRRVRKKLDTM